MLVTPHTRKEIYAALGAPEALARAIAWCDAAICAAEADLSALKARELDLVAAWTAATDKVRGGWPSPERAAAHAVWVELESLREARRPLRSALSEWEDRAQWLRDGYPMYGSGSYDPDGGPFGTEGAWGD